MISDEELKHLREWRNEVSKFTEVTTDAIVKLEKRISDMECFIKHNFRNRRLLL